VIGAEDRGAGGEGAGRIVLDEDVAHADEPVLLERHPRDVGGDERVEQRVGVEERAELGDGDALVGRELLQASADSVADEEGFVVVYPDGTGPVPTWNAGECCGFAAREDVDDVGFVVALIDQLEVELAIDPDQVVATGHSNGSTMSYRLACELSDRIVASGVQAAPLTYEGCEPSGPVSVLHVHGAQDANVPIDGGVGVGISGLDWPPVVEGVWLMADAAGCGSEPTVDRTEPGVERSTWDGCAEGSRVELIVVDAGGHGWMRPGGSGARGDADDVGFDSTAQIWEFLSGQLDR
jgi:polyhydroxybutyrate depolymerase